MDSPFPNRPIGPFSIISVTSSGSIPFSTSLNWWNYAEDLARLQSPSINRQKWAVCIKLLRNPPSPRNHSKIITMRAISALLHNDDDDDDDEALLIAILTGKPAQRTKSPRKDSKR